MLHTIRVVAAAAMVLTAAGCGGKGDGFAREPVSGKVSFDGKPLDDGQITFTPEAGGEPAAGAAIKDGAYSLGRSEGPAVGPQRVNVWSRKPTGKKVASDDQPGTFVDVTSETIPDRYNVQSELKADVQKGGTNQFNFELTSKGAATKGRP